MTADGRDETMVVIVGAGLSGLIAARDLHRAGIDVLVLEAAERIGGRALSETSALGSRLDLGGQWVGHDHHRLIALAEELGVRRFAMHTGRMPRLVDGDRTVRVVSAPTIVAGAALLVVGVLARTGRTERWNATTLQAALDRVPGRTARRLLKTIALISWTFDLDRLSIHAMARMIRNQGGLRTILATRDGAQDALLVEGAGTLVDRLAAGLGPRVRTGEAVTAIVRDDTGVTVRTASTEARARKVIVTAPAPVAARIAHDPPLPPDHAELQRTTAMGTVYKAIAVYDTPFWRARGGCELLDLAPPARAVFDTSQPDGPGHLCVLVGGSEARQLDDLDPDARRQAVLGSLATHLGREVLEPASWHEKAWHLDAHAGGGYTALPAPGTTAGLPPFGSAPVGHVHWAGSETAGDHAGYFEGAIDAGQRAAREVVDALPR